MRRVLLVLAVAALMAVMIVASAMPVLAREGAGPSACKSLDEKPGQDFSSTASNGGFSVSNNPGNAGEPFGPLVPFSDDPEGGIGCNPILG